MPPGEASNMTTLGYAWLIAALAFGVPAEEHDATVYTLG